MFEQATLTNGPAGKRLWATFLGFSSQAVLVTFAVMAPMMWPQILPTARIWESLAPPLPPVPRPLGQVRHTATSARPTRGLISLAKYQPTSIPTTVPAIVEEPVDVGIIGVPPGLGGGDQSGGVIGAIMSDAAVLTPVAPPKPAAVPAKSPEIPAAIPRFKVGGNVHLGALLHHAEPQYPALAKSARVSGDVELECVVGVDGHIQQVKVISGNGLLVRAAVDAAWQWVYSPSKLNDKPIEIITNLKFSFKLN